MEEIREYGWICSLCGLSNNPREKVCCNPVCEGSLEKALVEGRVSAAGTTIPMGDVDCMVMSFILNGCKRTTKPVKLPVGTPRYMRYSVSEEGVTFLFSDVPSELDRMFECSSCANDFCKAVQEYDDEDAKIVGCNLPPEEHGDSAMSRPCITKVFVEWEEA